MSSAEEGTERLQKALSRAGVASRRKAEILLSQGRIRLNGQLVTELGTRVNPDTDVVEVNGQVVNLRPDTRYVLLHKPTGIVTSLADERGRPDLNVFLEKIGERLFPVGRLDQDTSGLLILTNDGDAAHILAHPSFEVRKTYRAIVRGVVSPAELKTLLTGVDVGEGLTVKADRATIIGQPGEGKTLLEITLHSGQNRVVRRMAEAISHPVVHLHRVSFGPFHLGGLKSGEFRDFQPEERHALATLVERARKAQRSEKRG